MVLTQWKHHSAANGAVPKTCPLNVYIATKNEVILSTACNDEVPAAKQRKRNAPTLLQSGAGCSPSHQSKVDTGLQFQATAFSEVLLALLPSDS
eukprot:5473829-Amphidinium_carterae.1